MYYGFSTSARCLVWGRPAVGALSRNRDLPDPSLGFASRYATFQKHQLIFTERYEDSGYLKLQEPLRQPLQLYCRNREYCGGGYLNSDRVAQVPSLDVDGSLLWNGDQMQKGALSHSLSDQG